MYTCTRKLPGKQCFQQKLRSFQYFFPTCWNRFPTLLHFAVNTMYFSWHSHCFTQSSLGHFGWWFWVRTAACHSWKDNQDKGTLLPWGARLKEESYVNVWEWWQKWAYSSKSDITFPYYQALFGPCQSLAEGSEMSFVLIRLILETNQRRWTLTFIFPPASQFQNINVLDVLIEPDN